MNASLPQNVTVPADLVAHLRTLANTRPADTALIVAAAETETVIRYAELDRRVRALAAQLQVCFEPGDRAMLLLDNNEHYVVGFLGCLYAGLIAVPAFPPESLREQHIARLQSIVHDARPRCVLTSSDLLPVIEHAKDLLRGLDPVVVDAIAPSSADRWVPRSPDDRDVIFLQYTSGSTAAPKGVIVDHGNLIANESAIRAALETGPRDVFVSWLPLFHDMGLVGGLFQPIYSGIPLVLMSPACFLERPVRWLEQISRHRGTISGGPDFAYRLCLERIPDAQIKSLDLSGWRVAFSGAEPVRHDTLSAFAERFRAVGFDAQALYPCYGLAEATLFVTGGKCGSGMTTRTCSNEHLAKGRAVASKQGTTLVGCGVTHGPHRVRVVDPATGEKQAGTQIGEIWVSGPSVSRGYWHRDVETAATFVERDGAHWLRTGDLGFVQDKQLYITGRQKDLIILRGHNVYPQDIERAIEAEIEAVRKGRVAAFAVQTGAGEAVGVAVEVSRGLQKLIPPERLFEELSAIVAAACNEPLHVAILLNPGGLPKTSSGKVQRRACREGWIAGTLDSYCTLRHGESHSGIQGTRAVELTQTQHRISAIWSDVLNVQGPLPPTADFFSLGGNSITAAQVTARVSQEFAIRLNPDTLLAARTISAFSETVEQAPRQRASAPARIVRTQQMPLSAAQQRMWFLWQLQPNSAAYNLGGGLRLHGPLDVAILERTMDELVRRHEVLRTRFCHADGVVTQHIDELRPTCINLIDLRSTSRKARAGRVDELLLSEFQRPFDLQTGPLLRVTLLQLDAFEHVLFVTSHHVAVDGMSMALLMEDLVHIYRAFRDGRVPDRQKSSLQYIDYAAWQDDELENGGRERQLAYWTQKLGREYPDASPHPDRPRPAQPDYRGERHSIPIDPSLAQAVRSLSSTQGVTVFVVLLTAWKIVLARHSGQRDVRVGAPVANRRTLESESIVGPFLNTVVLRSDLGGNPSAVELLHRIEQTVLEAQINQDLPFDQLVETLAGDRALSRHPLFQVMHNHHSRARTTFEELAPLQVEPFDGPLPITEFDLSLNTEEQGGQIRAALKYSTAMYDESTVARIAGHWVNVLHAMVTAPEARVDEISLLGPEERTRLLQTFNDTTRLYAQNDTSVHRLVEQQVAQRPDAEAVVFEGTRCTYRELNQRANRLAWRLREHGVGPDVLVGICSERSVELVVGLLAILKAGGAYVPLDPAYPKSRLEFILDDARPRVVLVGRQVLGNLPETARTEAWFLGEEGSGERQDRDEDLPGITHPHNLVYCLYTSGSTGKPKCAANTQGALLNQMLWRQEVYRLDAHDRVLHKTPVGFDVSVWEIFWPLMTGATLVVAPPGAHRDPWRLRSVIQDERVTTLHFVPPMLTAFIEAGELAQCASLRRVFVGGQALATDTQAAFFQQCAAKLYNLYGPTESAIDVSYWECDPNAQDSIIPMGRALANTQLYVLDHALEPVPIGVVGELYIAGAQLARGYTGRPGLTASRFLANPFAPGERLYRSGDLARYRPDGAVEYVGRIDHQVKVRGFRIELGEIEARLREHPLVREAVVVVGRDLLGENELVAHVMRADVTEGGTARADSECRDTLHEYLAQRLPDYMLPAHYAWLDALPLLDNGKLDRAALSAYKPAAGGKPSTPPRTELERRVAAIWSEVLEVRGIGLQDSFFELGGHSLLATRIVSRIRTEFDIELPLRTIFEATRLAEFSEEVRRRIDDGARNTLGPIEPVDRSRPLPLSYAQQRMWLLWQIDPQSVAYNLAGQVKLTGPLSYVAIEDTLRTLGERHESLRTTFRVVNGVPVQDIATNVEIPVERLDLRALNDADRQAAVKHHAVLEAHRPFDLQTGPLLRVLLLRLADRDHVMVVTTHHIVAEGWAIEVFAREFMALYDGFSKGRPGLLPPLPVQYADYMHWHTRWLASGELERQTDYWKQQLAGDHEILALPSDRPRPKVMTTRGDVHRFAIEPALAQRLREFSREHDLTLFMTLIAGFFALLYRYSRQTDLRVGVPVANRVRPEAEGLIGAFLNMQVLRCRISDAMSFKQLLAQVREATLGAQAHQDLPFDRLVDAVNPPRGLGFHPLYQVIFNLHRWSFERHSRMGDVLVEVLPNDVRAAQLDLMLDVGDGTDALDCCVTYSTDLFDRATIERLSGCWVDILSHAIEYQEERIGSMPRIRDADRLLLDTWGVNRERPAPVDSAKWVHRLIEHQARLSPGSTALICGGTELTYAELNRRANRLARRLISCGTKPEDCLGIAVERSVEMVVALLAVLKAGGAYLPLDPAHPPERLGYMMRDSGTSMLLTSSRVIDRLGDRPPCAVVLLDQIDWQGGQERDPEVVLHREHSAYTIYTSGSTGRPKGVQVRHGSLSNFLLSMRETPGLSRADVLVAVTSLSFDIAALELYLPLIVGARVVLATEAQAHDGRALAELLEEHRATVLQATPAGWRLLLAGGWQGPGTARLKALCGGEALQADLAQQLRGKNLALWNMYGPTETTVWSSTAGLTDDVLSLGQPIAATRLRILTADLDLAPPGVPGELCIGGEGLARGYFRRPALTSERFVADPLSTQGERLYRTGDLARWSADGALEHLGRIDHQVKIRGFRIEPGEIESQLLAQHGVREAVVVPRSSAAGIRLVAYIAGNKDVELNSSMLRERLAQLLPDYMVPVHVMVLESLPLNVNGKVDRKALPEPEHIHTGHYEAPRGEIEEALSAVWSEVLGVGRAGRHDNFFELGGDSILSLKVVAKAHERGIALVLRQVFEHQVLRELAESIALSPRAEQPGSPQIRVANRTRPLPLSPAQMRQWFLWQLDKDSTAYHIATGLRLKGDLDTEALKSVFTTLVSRHESLRTVFRVSVDGEVEQVIQAPGRFELLELDVSGESRDIAEIMAAGEARRILHTPFDLTAGPLFRVGLIRVRGDEHVLVVVMHHIVSDGWSLQVIADEFVELYRAHLEGRNPDLAPLPIQYADYAVWQRNWLAAGEQERQLAYWKQQLGDEHPVLLMPTDYPRYAEPKYRLAHHELDLPATLTEELQKRAREHRATLFMVLLAGLQVLLHRNTGLSDIRVGANNANRHRLQTHGIVGFFVNPQVIRSHLDGHTSLSRLLAHVRDAVLGAQEHQDLPFEQLVEASQSERSLAHHPLFQILMDHQRRDHSGLQSFPGLSVQPYPLGDRAAKFELLVSTTERVDGSVGISLGYAAELFKPETVARFGAQYLRILQAIATDPEQLVRDVTLLSHVEQELLRHWASNEAPEPGRCEAPVQERRIEPLRRRKRPEKDSGVLFGSLPGGGSLPVQCSADAGGMPLKLWIRAHRREIDEALSRRGAILFRGFGVRDATTFNACIDAISGKALEYTFRSSPRTQVEAGLNIYTSTDYPAHERIFPHNENSYCSEFPLKLFFYCETPAAAGGETPLCDTREVLRRIDPDVREEFARKRVMYIRNFGDGLGVSWQTAFQTNSREAVETYCRKADITPRWMSDGRLQTCRTGPAVIRHPVTGELSWFNHATFFNALLLPESIRGALLSAYAPDELPQNTFYGDGSSIEPEVIQHLKDAYRGALVQFPWREGDVLMVDNVSVAHARNEFVGPRRILVGMAGTGVAADVELSEPESREYHA